MVRDTLTRQVNVSFGPTPPGAPTIIWPTSGMVLGSNRPDISFQGDRLTVTKSTSAPSTALCPAAAGFRVREPEPGPRCYIGNVRHLERPAYYYVFARLHNPNGWGPWTACGHYFYVSGEFLPVPGQSTNDPYCLDNGPSYQRDHSFIYDPVNNKFVLAYADFGNGSNLWVSAYMLDPSGARPFGETMMNGGNQSGVTSVAYNSVHDEYLVTDVDYEGILQGQRIVAKTGGLTGTTYPVFTGSVRGPALAYGTGSDVYLHVFSNTAITKVSALRLKGADGTAIGSPIVLAQDTTYALGSAHVVYNPDRDESWWYGNTRCPRRQGRTWRPVS